MGPNILPLFLGDTDPPWHCFQPLICVRRFAAPCIETHQASVSFILSQSLLKRVSDAIHPSHPLSPHYSCLQSFPASGSFPVSQLFASGGQCIGASVSTSVLPVNIQGQFPLGLTGLVSLLSKGLSRVFSSNTVQNINTSVLSLLYGPAPTSVHDYWKSHS